MKTSEPEITIRFTYNPEAYDDKILTKAVN